MNAAERLHTEPLNVPHTKRNVPVAVLTSPKAGVCYPLAFIPMLREDSLNGKLRVNLEMMETREILMNRTYARVTAYVVPLLALERFQGSRDQFDRSFMGQPKDKDAGAPVVPWIQTHARGAVGAYPVYDAVGLHGAPSDQVNDSYLEAYNLVWNFRAKNRSMKITKRALLNGTFAPAFWPQSVWAHVVPEFDQAAIDGKVALDLVQARMPIKGLGRRMNAMQGAGGSQTVLNTEGQQEVYANALNIVPFDKETSPGFASLVARGKPGTDYQLDIYAELQKDGVQISLSNIEAAKKTAWFANLRTKFEGHDDEFIIDMLMNGLTIPDQHLKQPILIADKMVPFGQAKRYATDAGHLTESAVSGACEIDLELRVPRLATGGVIVVQVECFPEQLWERQRDPWFHIKADADSKGVSPIQEVLPEYVRDTLDPEKVDVVLNGQVDTSHTQPTATFGYEPMNARWNRAAVRVGGKFLRPTSNTTTDDARMRLWAVETVDPGLTEAFYLVKNMHTKVFLDTAGDPFEATVRGNCVLDGLTVFGGLLVESTSNYAKVAAQVPKDRINKGA